MSPREMTALPTWAEKITPVDMDGACVSCGHHSDAATPWCEREDLPSRFLRDDGSPLFYRAALRSQP